MSIRRVQIRRHKEKKSNAHQTHNQNKQYTRTHNNNTHTHDQQSMATHIHMACARRAPLILCVLVLHRWRRVDWVGGACSTLWVCSTRIYSSHRHTTILTNASSYLMCVAYLCALVVPLASPFSDPSDRSLLVSESESPTIPYPTPTPTRHTYPTP